MEGAPGWERVERGRPMTCRGGGRPRISIPSALGRTAALCSCRGPLLILLPLLLLLLTPRLQRGMTPLHVAAAAGSSDILAMILATPGVDAD